jgi:ferredoxin--NADP+ reductase
LPKAGSGSGKVAGIKFERMQLDGTGNAKGTGEFIDYPVQAVYRAIGYHGSALDELEYDAKRGVIPNEGGRVLDAEATRCPGSTPPAGSSAVRWA